MMSPAKAAESIEMPSWLRTRVGPRNHVLDGSRSPMGRGNLRGGKEWPIVKYKDTAVSCAKMAELIEMPFGIWTRVVPRKHVLREAAH